MIDEFFFVLSNSGIAFSERMSSERLDRWTSEQVNGWTGERMSTTWGVGVAERAALGDGDM